MRLYICHSRPYTLLHQLKKPLQHFCHEHNGFYTSTKRSAVAAGSHLREVSCSEPAEAELEAVGLGEEALRSQADCLARRGNQPASLKHFSPAVRHGGYVPCFDHVL